MKKKRNLATRHIVCINNEGYKASLETGKLYRTLPDEKAASHGYMRVIDESGEDYGYSATRFIPIKPSRVVEKALYYLTTEQEIIFRLIQPMQSRKENEYGRRESVL